MHVIERTPRVAILDAQPGFAIFRDDPEFPVPRNVETLGPTRSGAGIREIALRKQVHPGRRPSVGGSKKKGREME